MSSNHGPERTVHLRRRLLAVTLGLVTVTLLIAGVAVFVIASRSLWRNLDASLIQVAKTEIASATDTGTLHIHETGSRTLEVAGVVGYEKFVWLEDGHGRILAASANVRASHSITGVDEAKLRALQGTTSFSNVEIDGRPARAVCYGFPNTDGQPAVGIVCVPSSGVADLVTQIGELILIVGVVCIAAVAITAWFLTRMISEPIEGLADQVRTLEPHAKSSAPPLHPPYAELEPLTHAFNGLVGRVGQLLAERESTIDRQRRFVADTSHELRTPVSNLYGTLEVALRRERSEDEYRSALRVSLGEVQRLTRLVEDLLILAKSDEGALDIRRTQVDLTPILRDALQAAQRAGIEGTLDANQALPVNVDAIRIRQALDNLLSNAFVHASRRVMVSATQEQDTTLICVGNDGPPLSSEEAVAIFERFHRLDHSRARNTGGSGLGLAIVKAIAAGHGGSVAVSSNENGTTFELRIPGTA